MIYVSGEPLSLTTFPDNTSQCWKLPDHMLSSPFVMIRWDYSNEAEVMHLAQLKQLLDHYKVDACLTINYLPYARQDKEIDNNATFALRTFAHIINSLHFKLITIMDPHSKVALDLIHNSAATYPIVKLQETIQKVRADLLCYPDRGALAKYTKEYDLELGYIKHIYGEKVRDQLTGNITSYKVIGNATDKNVLIVDDICDGGATFKLLAKDLLAAGARSVSLFVTHGIFSRGVRVLFDSGIDRIFTKDGEISKQYDRQQF